LNVIAEGDFVRRCKSRRDQGESYEENVQHDQNNSRMG
jgi:hypothetical protein